MLLLLTTLLAIFNQHVVADNDVTPSTIPSPHAHEMSNEEMSSNGPSVIVVGKFTTVHLHTAIYCPLSL
jgi:hypothetical protein